MTIGQSSEMQTKQNYQFLSVMIANDKLIGLGIIKLKDTDLFLEPSSPLVTRFERVYVYI